MQENTAVEIQKTIKTKRGKWRRFFLSCLIALLSLIIIPSIAINIPFVQTFVVKQISHVLSRELKTKVSVESVNIRLLNKILLKGVYVEDITKDTLMYVSRIEANISRLPIRGNTLILNSLKLADGVFTLRSDSTGVNVSQILANIINKEDKDTVKNVSSFRLHSKALELKNFRYNMNLVNGATVEEQPEGIIYKNMAVSEINLAADRITLKNDTLSFRVNNLSFKERSGLNMRQMSVDTGYIWFGREVTLRELRMVDDFSDIRMRNLSMIYNGGEEFKKFVNKVNFVVDIYNSSVSFTTVGYFAPVLNNIPVTARVNGYITGPVANLRSDNLKLSALDKTDLDGRFSITGLPDIKSTIIFADLKHLNTYSKDILTIISEITNNTFEEYKKTLEEFGDIKFNGTFTGFISDFVSNGYLRSNLGALKMDILVKNRGNVTGFNGNLAAININAGKMLNAPALGAANFNLMVDGKIQKGRNDIFGKGKISSLEFNNYKYQNIELEGRFINQAFDGEVKIHEPNIDFDFKGQINLAGDERDKIPVFDFDADIRHLDLVKLNINKRDSIGIVNAKIDANFKASGIWNYMGELNINNLSYTDHHGKIDIGNIGLRSFNNDRRNFLELKSEFADIVYRGQNDLGGFINQLEYITYKTIPNLFAKQKQIAPEQLNPRFNYDFKTVIKDAEELTRLLVPGLYVEKNTELNIKIDTVSNIDFELISGEVSFNGNSLSNLKLTSNNINDSLKLNLLGNLSVMGLNIPNIEINNTLANNIAETDINFIDAENNSSAKIGITSKFCRDSLSHNLFSDINIHKSGITVLGNPWNLEPALASIKKESVSVSGFNFHRNGQHFRISGTASENPTDSLKINMDNYRLIGLNSYSASRGYNLDGLFSGEIEIRGLYGVPLLIGNLQIDTMIVNKDTLGSIIIGSMWNTDKERLDFTTRIYDQKSVSASVNGHMTPETGALDGLGTFNELKLNALTPLLKGVLSDITGTANGSINIGGTFKKPELTGVLSLKDAGLSVDYLGTRYFVNGDINVSNTRLNITDGEIKDIEGNTGSLAVDFTHNYFKDFNLSVNTSVNNFLSLDTKEKDNPQFYGKAYTTGVINIVSDFKKFDFDITAQTNSKTLLYIPLTSASQSKDLAFLTFVNKDTLDTEKTDAKKRKQANISVGMDLDVTPETEIQILIDPKVGDIIKAKGVGNLKINVVPILDVFTIVGDFTIESGEYNFTVPTFSIISRKFNIEKGSRIHFNGNISNAVLDVTASSKERVSLSTLFPEDSLRNYSVVCQILINGRMTNPSLKFNIDILDIDPEKKAQFQSLVNTEEKMIRQFLAVLVFKSFLPEQNTGSQDLGSATLLANATELLSAQIGSLISLFNLPIPIDVNVDYSANSNNNAGSEFGVDISTQLFDRVLLNGSASNATRSNRSFVGDFEAEVLLGKRGNTRFKAFSKSRDYFSDDMENNRNGIGISYQSQFDKFIDLFKRKKKKKKETKAIIETKTEDEQETKVVE